MYADLSEPVTIGPVAQLQQLISPLVAEGLSWSRHDVRVNERLGFSHRLFDHRLAGQGALDRGSADSSADLVVTGMQSVLYQRSASGLQHY